MTYEISRRVVLFGALPAACGMAAPSEQAETPRLAPRRGTRPAPLPAPVIDVSTFGASPTASAQVNTAAFARASAEINRAGGGTLQVPPGTYRVGAQSGPRGRGRGVSVADHVIRIEGCRRPVAVLGGGATLKVVDGMRFGAFDPQSGRAHKSRMPFLDPDYRVDGCILIYVGGCAGSVRIEDFDLDGNSRAYALGGEWGDTGRQAGGDGLICEGNTGGVHIANITSRDHGRDGIMLIHYGLTARSPQYPVTLTDVVCTGNARQGLSWVGGNRLTARRCRFERTGRGRFASAPGAGLDIEAEGSVCRNGHFTDCRFVDNVGCGLVADSGDSADMLFERCTYIGTTNWSAWPRKPGFVFRDCLFVGSIVNVFGDADPRRATQFIGCRFHADPALSPGGRIYGSHLADLGSGAANVLMRNCDFYAKSPSIALPWTPADIRYDNCRFRQTGTMTSYPRGVFTGTTRIVSAGNVELYGSQLKGPVTLNDKALN